MMRSIAARIVDYQDLWTRTKGICYIWRNQGEIKQGPPSNTKCENADKIKQKHNNTSHTAMATPRATAKTENLADSLSAPLVKRAKLPELLGVPGKVLPEGAEVPVAVGIRAFEVWGWLAMTLAESGLTPGAGMMVGRGRWVEEDPCSAGALEMASAPIGVVGAGDCAAWVVAAFACCVPAELAGCEAAGA